VGGATSVVNGDKPDIIFSEEIGLAIERPPKGVTLE